MNEKLNYSEVEVGQSSKGVWYCKSIKVAESDSIAVGSNIDHLIEDIEIILKHYNEPEKPEKTEEK